MSIGKTAEYVTFVKNTDSSVVNFKATKIRFSADRKSVTVLSWGDNMDSWIGSIFPFQMLLIASLFSPPSTLNLSLLQVINHTGYTLKQVEEFFPKEFKSPKYFKCGKYVESLRDKAMGKYEDHFILASTNQRFSERIGETFNYRSCSSNRMEI